jgi:hypothetical protein
LGERVQARPLPERSHEWSSVAVHKDRIGQWLTAPRPLRLKKIHTLLVRNHDWMRATIHFGALPVRS